MKLHVRSSEFEEGQPIPALYTRDGADVSPPLSWSDAPPDTVTFAVLCEDPDAPRGLWVHWVLYNISGDLFGLKEGLPPSPSLPGGARQGKNDFGRFGYGGPSPPPGKPHRYFFKVYALDEVLSLPEGATRVGLLEAMKGHVLAEGQLMGTYQR